MSRIGWQEINEEDRERIKRDFPVSLINDLVRYDNGFVMPRKFAEKIEERIYNFELRDDDIWIVTYPKSGTTWTQELVWMLVNDVDIEKGRVPLAKRSPFIEVDCLFTKDILKSLGVPPAMLNGLPDDQIEYANTLEGRRVIKSHLPFEFLPPRLLERCKVVYVARNPKDTAVSFYHHNLNVPGHGFVGTFDGFMKYFEEGLHVFGSYWHHILSGWQNRHHKNVKFVWFEDMKRDTKNVIDELIILHHPLSEDLKGVLNDHVQFENMKKNPYANPTAIMNTPPEKQFMRKGQVGDWKNYFDKERDTKWEHWIAENIEGTGLEEVEHLKHIRETN